MRSLFNLPSRRFASDRKTDQIRYCDALWAWKLRLNLREGEQLR